MIRSRSSVLVFLLALAGCPDDAKDGSGSAPSAKETAATTAKAAPSATAAAAFAPRKLEPLPLTLELPASASIEKGAAGGVMISEGKTGLTVAPVDGDLAKEKKALETLPLFTFQKWLKQEKDLAVAEFMGPDYRAIFVVEVGGKKYTCKNVGAPAASSAEEAESRVRRCAGLKPS
jgi:hypothetical protein